MFHAILLGYVALLGLTFWALIKWMMKRPAQGGSALKVLLAVVFAAIVQTVILIVTVLNVPGKASDDYGRIYSIFGMLVVSGFLIIPLSVLVGACFKQREFDFVGSIFLLLGCWWPLLQFLPVLFLAWLAS